MVRRLFRIWFTVIGVLTIVRWILNTLSIFTNEANQIFEYYIIIATVVVLFVFLSSKLGWKVAHNYLYGNNANKKQGNF